MTASHRGQQISRRACRVIGPTRHTPILATSYPDPQMKSKLSSFGYTIVRGTSADFGKLIADETEKWAKVVKFAGIKPE